MISHDFPSCGAPTGTLTIRVILDVVTCTRCCKIWRRPLWYAYVSLSYLPCLTDNAGVLHRPGEPPGSRHSHGSSHRGWQCGLLPHWQPEVLPAHCHGKNALISRGRAREVHAVSHIATIYLYVVQTGNHVVSRCFEGIAVSYAALGVCTKWLCVPVTLETVPVCCGFRVSTPSRYHACRTSTFGEHFSSA